MTKFSASEIAAKKKEALQKIKTFLDVDDVDGQFKDRDLEHSKDKFIVTWLGNYKGIPSEYRIDLCDSFYTSFSGYKAVYVAVGLFHQKQLKGYQSIERALIDVGLKLCPASEKKAFFDKYCIRFNEKIDKLIALQQQKENV